MRGLVLALLLLVPVVAWADTAFPPMRGGRAPAQQPDGPPPWVDDSTALPPPPSYPSGTAPPMTPSKLDKLCKSTDPGDFNACLAAGGVPLYSQREMTGMAKAKAEAYSARMAPWLASTGCGWLCLESYLTVGWDVMSHATGASGMPIPDNLRPSSIWKVGAQGRFSLVPVGFPLDFWARFGGEFWTSPLYGDGDAAVQLSLISYVAGLGSHLLGVIGAEVGYEGATGRWPVVTGSGSSVAVQQTAVPMHRVYMELTGTLRGVTFGAWGTYGNFTGLRPDGTSFGSGSFVGGVLMRAVLKGVQPSQN